MREYKKYGVWQDSIQLTSQIYELTRSFPDDEKFGLTNQIRRATISIASNIAEGASRSSTKDFSRFLEIAQGSSFEVDTQLLIAKNLSLITESDFNTLSEKISSIGKQISGLKRKLA
ncbi:MAG: four helix bundle protein [Bacteroidota bacterium]